MPRLWTIEERNKQADRIRIQSPWKKSTGPKTMAGKAISSQNAYKHGGYRLEMKLINLALRKQRAYIATLRLHLRNKKEGITPSHKFLKNELSRSHSQKHKNATHSNANSPRSVLKIIVVQNNNRTPPLCHPRGISRRLIGTAGIWNLVRLRRILTPDPRSAVSFASLVGDDKWG